MTNNDTSTSAAPAVAAVLEGGVTVACTHLSFSPPTAVRQLRRLRHWLAQAPGPVRLLLGDLNLPSVLPGAVCGGQRLVRAPTFPAARPRLQLDHVLALQGAVTAATVDAALDLGDHRPLVVDIAGPTRFVIEGDDLVALAAGWRLAMAGDQPAWIGPAPE